MRLVLSCLATLALCGCVGTVEETNGPVGDAKVTWGPPAPPWPWRVDNAPATKVVKKASTCGSEESCEGPNCAVLPK